MTPRSRDPVIDAFELAAKRARVARERALRWEAIARQLGDAVEAATHEWSQPIADQVLAALSVYRAAVKESE